MNFVLLPQSRNIIERFMKSYLHRPIKSLQFLTQTRIQKCLEQLKIYYLFQQQAT